METERFWMVYVGGGNAPGRKHPTLQDAMAEAERLFPKRGLPVYVLMTVKVCKDVQITGVWEDLEGNADAAK